jgi:hypothetical protein
MSCSGYSVVCVIIRVGVVELLCSSAKHYDATILFDCTMVHRIGGQSK